MATYQIAHLVGITREHETQFRTAEKILTKQRYIVLAPVIYNIEEYKAFGEYPNMLDEMCYQKLLLCDFIVIVTPEHIGKSTQLRIKQARQLHKTIYVLENETLQEYKEETS